MGEGTDAQFHVGTKETNGGSRETTRTPTRRRMREGGHTTKLNHTSTHTHTHTQPRRTNRRELTCGDDTPHHHQPSVGGRAQAQTRHPPHTDDETWCVLPSPLPYTTRLTYLPVSQANRPTPISILPHPEHPRLPVGCGTTADPATPCGIRSPMVRGSGKYHGEARERLVGGHT